MTGGQIGGQSNDAEQGHGRALSDEDLTFEKVK